MTSTFLLLIFLIWHKTNVATVIRTRNCKLAKTNTNPAGPVQNVNAFCQYSPGNGGKYFYNITWNYSKTNLDAVLTSFRVLIKYKSPEKKFCFNISNLSTHFIFDETMGFLIDRSMWYAITAEPILLRARRKEVNMYKSEQCPGPVELEHLPNVAVEMHSNHSFQCKFSYNTFSKHGVFWYFTKDIQNCTKSRVLLKNITDKIEISNNNKTLKVVNASTEDIGCYVLVVVDGKGNQLEIKGYLNLKKKDLMVELFEEDYSVMIIIVSILSVLLVFVLLLIIKKTTPKLKLFTRNFNSANKTVYISHCLKKAEGSCLSKLAMLLNDANINIIVDIYSIVAINNAGGIANWVTRCIDLADKILIIVDDQYLKVLESYRHDEKLNEEDEKKLQIHTEFTCYTNKGFDKIVVLRRGVDVEELSNYFRNVASYPMNDNEIDKKVLESCF